MMAYHEVVTLFGERITDDDRKRIDQLRDGEWVVIDPANSHRRIIAWRDRGMLQFDWVPDGAELSEYVAARLGGNAVTFGEVEPLPEGAVFALSGAGEWTDSDLDMIARRLARSPKYRVLKRG